MINFFKKTVVVFRKEPFIALFIATIVGSWICHTTFRTQHFQEVDSSGTYHILYDFPESAIRSIALTYTKGNIFSEAEARRILELPSVEKISKTYFPKLDKVFLINQLSNTSLLAAFRYALIELVTISHLPFAFQSFFSMGLGSTYSSGAGLVYGLLSGAQTSYEDFMSRSMLVSITLFHISILLLFLILKKLEASNFTSIAISIIALFSISLYSSGIHIGSTIWNISSEFFWIWYLLKNIHDPKLSQKMSGVSAILIFFNYLILLFWLAFICKEIISKVNTGEGNLRSFLKYSWNEIKGQRIAILFIGLCAILFFQPGQGFRGTTTFAQLPRDTYYILLNFFSWYTHSTYVDIIQIFVGLVFAVSIIFFYKSREDNITRMTTKKILGIVGILYVILVLSKTLSFLPTRHILFMVPFVFISAGIGIDIFLKKRNWSIGQFPQFFIITAMICAGFFSIYTRQSDALDLTSDIHIDNDVTSVGIYDASYSIVYAHTHDKIPVSFINPEEFKKGKIYLYVSQVAPFSTALSDWQRKYNITTKIIWESNENNQTYFIAHNPDFERLRYSRPNSLFQTKFEVLDINKK